MLTLLITNQIPAKGGVDQNEDGSEGTEEGPGPQGHHQGPPEDGQDWQERLVSDADDQGLHGQL